LKSGAGALSFFFGSGAGAGEPPSRGAGEGAPEEALRAAADDLEGRPGAGAGPESEEAALAEADIFLVFFLSGRRDSFFW
jgi:hypothetical protein